MRANRFEKLVKEPNHPRDYPIFRPRENERPDELLGFDATCEIDLDSIRVAKHQDLVVAAYQFRQLSTLVYEIERLGVHPSYRGQGLGKWMLAHVVGIIESKGGREVVVQTSPAKLLTGFGFERCGDNQLRLTLTAE